MHLILYIAHGGNLARSQFIFLFKVIEDIGKSDAREGEVPHHTKSKRMNLNEHTSLLVEMATLEMMLEKKLVDWKLIWTQ